MPVRKRRRGGAEDSSTLDEEMDFADSGLILQMVVSFGGGMVAFLSPCVLPMLPGYLGLMSGYSVANLQTGEVSRKTMLRVTTLFVFGFTVVFVATGAAATRISNFLSTNQRTTNVVAGALVLAFGLAMVGMALTTRGIFGFLSRERRVEVRPSRLGAWAPPLMGAAFGFGWTPCIGPILGGVLLLASTRETVGQGMVLLFAFSLGLGVPFILSGIGLARAFRAFKALRRWMRPISVAGGVVMATFGVVMMTNQVGRLAGMVTNVFTAVPFLEWLAQI
jgi:cytochrome c-type biogenesis protein